MTKQHFFSLFLGILMLISLATSAQDRQALEKQREKLKKAIEYNQQQLDKIDENKKKSLSQLELLIQQIDTRQKVINNITKEISQLESSINETEAIVTALGNDLEELKKRYAEMIYQAYKGRSVVNDLVFLFSASSFNDAIQRLRYLQQYSEFKKRQAELIVETQEMLSKKIADLEGKKQEQQNLLDQQVAQRKKLNTEKLQKNEWMTDLKKKEKKLIKEIEDQQKESIALNKKIEDIIKKEIELAKKKAAEEANKNKSTTASANIKLSAKFVENKGKLPMPVEKGVVTGKFGTHPHPVYGDKVIINNNGIDIRTDENATVKSIFDGEVISVVYNPGFQRGVIIKHGDYFTVYSKLNTVNVKPGDRVTTGQVIGVAFTNQDKATTEVHFELWEGINKLNPALWIYAQ